MLHILAGGLLAATAVYVAFAWIFTSGLSRLSTPPAGGSQERPFVSVVIAARNESDFIEQCLQGLTLQTYPADRFEVLVVDDTSADDTAAIVERFCGPGSNIRLLEVGNAFPERAAKKRPMSVGILAARGEIILTTDADCTVPPTWIASVVTYFTPDVGVVIGFSQIKSANAPLTALERLQALDFLALMAAAGGAAGAGLPLAATGQNLAYRKSLFEQVGGFRDIAHRPSGDDVLLLQLMRRKAGARAAFAADSRSFISTWRTESPSGLWRQRRRWASNAPVQLYLNPVFFTYIVTVFLTNLLGPLCLLTGWVAGGRYLALACLLLKALGDFTVIYKGMRRFGRTDLLGVLPIWWLIQFPYTILVGIGGSLGGFKWKGRRHCPQISPSPTNPNDGSGT
jgi:cellulose synthase/poly-beta-1,6-N-acetylglucosamine synthase-like glycosyltransferase